jgi:predicted glutamate--cysteine ligase
MANPELDPLVASTLPAPTRADDLVTLTDENEAAAAEASLDAELRHWQDGKPILAREWIEALYQEMYPIAKQQGFGCFLTPVKKILREGNEAQRWLKLIDQGMDVQSVVAQAIQTIADQELLLANELCQPQAA